MSFKKIALFYGHVASDIGALAINRGEVELLKQSFPGAQIHIVMLNAAGSDVLRAARPSFGDDHSLTLSYFAATPTRALEFQAAPAHLLAECGAGDADLIVLASGEHFFSYAGQGNAENLFWHALPALAARVSGKPSVVLPSTFGPFEEQASVAAVRALTSLADAVAAREPASAQILAAQAGVRDVPVMIDPAFFVGPRAGGAPFKVAGQKTLGLVMRPETSEIASSQAAQFSLALCRDFLSDASASVVLFVQTADDAELADHVEKELAAEGFGSRVKIRRPLSVEDYIDQLAVADYVVASRFHAVVLSVVAGTPSFGVYFDANGHKMSGLFELLGEKVNCLNLSAVDAQRAAKTALQAEAEAKKNLPALKEQVKKRKAELQHWLANVAPRPADDDVLAKGYEALGALAADLVRRDFSSVHKTEIESRAEAHSAALKELNSQIARQDRESEQAVRRAREDIAGEIAAMRARHAEDLKEANTRARDNLAREVATLRALHDKDLKDVHTHRIEASQRAHEESARKIATLTIAHDASVKEAERVRRQSESEIEALRTALTETEFKRAQAVKAVRKRGEALQTAAEEALAREEKLKAADRQRAGALVAQSDLRKQFAQEIDALNLAHDKKLKDVAAQRELKTDRESRARRHFEALQRDVAMAHLQSASAAAQANSFNLRNSTSFVLGAMIVAALRNPLKLVILPVTVVRAWSAARRRKQAMRAKGTTLSAEQARMIREAYGFKGYDGVIKLLGHMKLTVAGRAAAFDIVERSAQSVLSQTTLPAQGTPKAKLRAPAAKATKLIAFRSAPIVTLVEMREPAALVEIYGRDGAPLIVRSVKAHYRENKRDAARELLRMAKVLRDNNVLEADYPLTVAAALLDRSEGSLRALFWSCQKVNRFLEACDIMLELRKVYGDNPTADQQAFLEKLQKSPAFQLSLLKKIPETRVRAFEPVPKRLCYVLHNTLPYSSGGYATRAHGVLSGIREAGWDVVALSRPGFPLDIKHEMTEDQVPLVDMVDGIPYMRLLSPRRAGMSAFDYMNAAADAIEAKLREIKPSLVMAASNHVTGLPALIAASRLGIPFIYEIRGLWEITRVSREPTFEDNVAFHVQRTLEACITKGADHAFTLTEPMREELIGRGVDAHKLDLLPNSCDPSRFVPRGKDESLMARLGIPANVPIIGYVGTFVDYEGLEDLAEACALLKKRGTEFRLLMVGNENASAQSRGPITEWIDQVAKDHGFADWTILTGRVPHEEVESYYSLIDVCPFPRKPWPVCEMVSPMKPLEALAMEKAVVVSSVRALVEMIKDGETGLVFEKGNIVSLADTLQRAMNDPELRARLGKAGRRWVEQERTWTQVGQRFAAIVDTMLSEPPAAIAAQ